MGIRLATEAAWPRTWSRGTAGRGSPGSSSPPWSRPQDLGFTIVGTVPGAFDSTGHGRVGLHVMYLDLG
jgi:hypothetical protein